MASSTVVPSRGILADAADATIWVMPPEASKQAIGNRDVRR